MNIIYIYYIYINIIYYIYIFINKEKSPAAGHEVTDTRWRTGVRVDPSRGAAGGARWLILAVRTYQTLCSGATGLTCASSMSLCRPKRSCSVLLVLRMERLWDFLFCLAWRAAALLPLSTGISPSKPDANRSEGTKEDEIHSVGKHERRPKRSAVALRPRGDDAGRTGERATITEAFLLPLCCWRKYPSLSWWQKNMRKKANYWFVKKLVLTNQWHITHKYNKYKYIVWSIKCLFFSRA